MTSIEQHLATMVARQALRMSLTIEGAQTCLSTRDIREAQSASKSAAYALRDLGVGDRVFDDLMASSDRLGAAVRQRSRSRRAKLTAEPEEAVVGS